MLQSLISTKRFLNFEFDLLFKFLYIIIYSFINFLVIKIFSYKKKRKNVDEENFWSKFKINYKKKGSYF